jgi:hypothetical protein
MDAHAGHECVIIVLIKVAVVHTNTSAHVFDTTRMLPTLLARLAQVVSDTFHSVLITIAS